jgi:hypothetical protein
VDGRKGSIFDGNLAQLADFDAANPAVLDYLVDAYGHWIEQGADAFRIDTIAWMPPSFWHAFTRRIRANIPGFFMFGEAFDYDAAKIATHTLPGNGEVSVLDFPMKQAMEEVFGRKGAGYERLAPSLPHRRAVRQPLRAGHVLRQPRHAAAGRQRRRLHRRAQLAVHRARHPGGLLRLRDGLHARPRRACRQPQLLRQRGHRRGAAQPDPRGACADRQRTCGHARIAARRAGRHRTAGQSRRVLSRAAAWRTSRQIALVLLNKGDAAQRFDISSLLQPGQWRSALDGGTLDVRAGGTLSTDVAAHGVQVFVLDAAVTMPALQAALDRAMTGARRPR